MADLTLKASHEYWQQYSDPIIHRVLSFMESVETFPQLKNPLFDTIINELNKALSLLKESDINQPNQQDLFIRFGNELHMTQTLRLLQALDTAKAGSAARILMYAETMNQKSNSDSALFLQRNIIFERLRLLTRLFSQERLRLIQQALEE